MIQLFFQDRCPLTKSVTTPEHVVGNQSAAGVPTCSGVITLGFY